MLTHEELKAKALSNSLVKTEYDALNNSEEFLLLDQVLKARSEAGLTQDEVAKRMKTKAPAIARLEKSLISGKHSPSLATLRKYAKALGKRVEIRFV
ncbi:MAG: helix-turn-helix transcriptional regulator [Methylococcaceae bacterium]